MGLADRAIVTGRTAAKPTVRKATYTPKRKITARRTPTELDDKRAQTAARQTAVATRPKPTITDFDGVARRRALDADALGYDATTTAGGGGNTGGGNAGGGGGGGTGSPAPSAAEVKAEEEEEAAKAAAIADADEALDLQLKAIEAQYGMTRAQLEADQGEAGRQYRQAKAGLMRQRAVNLEANLNSMVERGIIKSGITIQNQADIEEGYADARGAALGDRDYQLAQIAAQKAALDPQQKLAESLATSEHEAALLRIAQLEALANGGL